MSDPIHHECGLALIRLKKPLAYFHEKYGSAIWGLNKLYQIMEKEHNRGQDGVGIGCCKLDPDIGQPYLFRERSAKRDSLNKVMEEIFDQYDKLVRRKEIDPSDPVSVKRNFDFAGEILMGHLRYGTSGRFGEGGCHPYLRRTNWPTKTLMVLGNFNMTNARDLNHHLINRGQHPVYGTDTQTVLEEIGFHLDEAHDAIYRRERDRLEGKEIPAIISKELDLYRILGKSADIWDGGYAIAGAIGNGDAFVLRDPNGIRPCHYYENDELIAFASERVPLMTVFDTDISQVHELPRGCAAVMKHTGEITIKPFTPKRALRPCSFERIYFSRGNDPDIYAERKKLGDLLVPQVLQTIGNDLENTVFSFVPNTAEIAYHGLMDGLRRFRRDEVKRSIQEAVRGGDLDESRLDDLILRNWPRGEKIAHKDVKARTFITQEKNRGRMVSLSYDITYGVMKPGDNLVIIDDSIVRGTTLRNSIIRILSRTQPKSITVLSTAPQIRYPDCYGIDMAEFRKFIAFEAMLNLIDKRHMRPFVRQIYNECVAELKKPVAEMRNCVKALYAPFTNEEISAEIARMILPEEIPWSGPVNVIFQTVENLHRAIPVHNGDWYFSGDYPTPGGYKIVNQCFLDAIDERPGRPYDVML